MKAMIFAAGLGTRLRPYTDHKPKALVEIDGMSLLEIQIRRLAHFGITDIVVNLHHHPGLMRDFLQKFQLPGLTLHVSDETDLLLDTGGGLMKALHFWQDDEPVFLCNVDVLTDLDPFHLLERHRSKQAQATLGLLKRATSRLLTFDQEMQLTGWLNQDSGESKGNPSPTDEAYAFCGLHIIQPGLLHRHARAGAFSVIDFYLDAHRQEPVYGADLKGITWLDVGKPAELNRGKELMDAVLPIAWR